MSGKGCQFHLRKKAKSNLTLDTVVTAGEWYYTGPSMCPTLKAGDILVVRLRGGTGIKRGDVIVFDLDRERRSIIHRVVSVNGGAIRTRGDNNREIDPWVVPPSDIVGVVTHALRSGKRRKIAGGVTGRTWAGALRCLRTGALPFKACVRPLYRCLSAAGTFGKLVPLGRPVRVIAVAREGGTEQKLLWGRHVIGRRPPHKGQWQIRHPFRLLVNESTLPDPSPVFDRS